MLGDALRVAWLSNHLLLVTHQGGIWLFPIPPLQPLGSDNRVPTVSLTSIWSYNLPRSDFFSPPHISSLPCPCGSAPQSFAVWTGPRLYHMTLVSRNPLHYLVVAHRDNRPIYNKGPLAVMSHMLCVDASGYNCRLQQTISMPSHLLVPYLKYALVNTSKAGQMRIGMKNSSLVSKGSLPVPCQPGEQVASFAHDEESGRWLVLIGNPFHPPTRLIVYTL